MHRGEKICKNIGEGEEKPAHPDFKFDFDFDFGFKFLVCLDVETGGDK